MFSSIDEYQTVFFKLGRPVILSYNGSSDTSANSKDANPLEVVFVTNNEGLSLLEDSITEVKSNISRFLRSI